MPIGAFDRHGRQPTDLDFQHILIGLSRECPFYSSGRTISSDDQIALSNGRYHLESSIGHLHVHIGSEAVEIYPNTCPGFVRDPVLAEAVDLPAVGRDLPCRGGV